MFGNVLEPKKVALIPFRPIRKLKTISAVGEQTGISFEYFLFIIVLLKFMHEYLHVFTEIGGDIYES